VKAAHLPEAVAIDWRRTVRLVASRYPAVSLFERVADPADLDAVFAIEALANPRLRQEAGEISLVPPADRVSGIGSTPVMAAFCHLNPEGSRFSDGTWGVYYAARTLATAVAEVAHHRARFLAATNEEAIEIDLRSYIADVQAELHDIRGPGWDAVHDPDDYRASQRLARSLRVRGSWGIAYRSVRHAGGECVAAFKPRAIRLPVVQGAHLTLHWNGREIDQWYEKSRLQKL
jgi:RES domain-containing protein